MSAARPRRRERLVLLHAERDLIVIDKPAALLTMPSAPGRAEHEDSVLARAREYARHVRGRQAYVGLLHRLDRGTSGALAIALSREAHAAGRLLFKAHRFDRTYLALVAGAPEADAGTIDQRNRAHERRVEAKLLRDVRLVLQCFHVAARRRPERIRMQVSRDPGKVARGLLRPGASGQRRRRGRRRADGRGEGRPE